jgi:ABC-type glycerol-3-phosphate transport system substrate-binding protein
VQSEYYKEEKMKKAYIALVLALALVAGLSAQTINVLFWDDAYPRTLMERIPEFEKATGIKVNFEILQPPQVFTKTSVSVTKERTDYDLVCVDEKATSPSSPPSCCPTTSGRQARSSRRLIPIR